MPSAFEDLCKERNVDAAEWKRELSKPIVPEKCLLDMTDEELDEHYLRVEERAENSREDRALIILERTQDGLLERQARRVFGNSSKGGNILAEQVPELLEQLRFQVTNTEVHYLLRKFEATEDFDMVPEAKLTKGQWLWLVGECQMLKESYQHLNPKAWEACYETLVQNLKGQKDAGLAGTSLWPHVRPTGPGWFFNGGVQPGYGGKLAPSLWGAGPEQEAELDRKMAEHEAEGKLQAAGTQLSE